MAGLNRVVPSSKCQNILSTSLEIKTKEIVLSEITAIATECICSSE